MINNISGGSMPSPPMQKPQSQPLTDDQLQTIESVLEEYEADNLSASDAKAIVELFKEADIRPGQSLSTAMSDAGFDAREVGELAGVNEGDSTREGVPPKQQPAALNISDQMLQDLNKLLDSYYNDVLSEEDKQSTLAAVKEIFEQGVPEGGLINLAV